MDRYGALTALAPPTLTNAAGERVVLKRPSGSGKTTLPGLPAAAPPPDAGWVLAARRPTTGLRPGRALARLVGVIPPGHDPVPSLAVVHNVPAGRVGESGLVPSGLVAGGPAGSRADAGGAGADRHPRQAVGADVAAVGRRTAANGDP